MAVNFRRVAQWSSAISVLLLITFMAVLPGTYEKMEPMLDPEQQNMARLEAGESASVDFVGGHVYVALRVNEVEMPPLQNCVCWMKRKNSPEIAPLDYMLKEL